MEIKEIDKILINLEVVASFKNLNSKTELSGEKCRILIDYIKELEEKAKING